MLAAHVQLRSPGSLTAGEVRSFPSGRLVATRSRVGLKCRCSTSRGDRQGFRAEAHRGVSLLPPLLGNPKSHTGSEPAEPFEDHLASWNLELEKPGVRISFRDERDRIGQGYDQ